MKVAKATPEDVNAIFDILQALDAISEGEMPGDDNEEINIGLFDLLDALDAGAETYVSDNVNYFIRQALKYLLNIQSFSSPTRAAWNLSAFLNPENEIVDPESSTLKMHPKIEQGLTDTDRLNWIIANGARIEGNNGEIQFFASLDDDDMSHGLIGIRDEIDIRMNKKCAT